MQKTLPDRALLQELLSYDPATGTLIWKKRALSLFPSDNAHRTWNTRYAGKPALNHIGSQGYRTGAILGTAYQAHRIIWKMLHGSDPDKIDHINGIRSDNREINLSDVTFSQNMRNQRIPKNNSSRAIGVYLLRPSGNWLARICVNRKQLNLGTYPTFEQALAARQAAEKAYNFHPNHGQTVAP